VDDRAIWLLALFAATACGGTSITNYYEPGNPPCAVAADACPETTDAAVAADANGPDSAPDTAPDVAADVAADIDTDVARDAPFEAQEAGVVSIGMPCMTDYDCVSSACDSVSLMCVASECTDHRVDGAETDVDCGGPACPVCATGQHCKVDTDCSTFACDAFTHVCITNRCADHTKDGDETDIDCGGAMCPGCALGDACKQPSDCANDICDLMTHFCIGNQCADHRQDGLESDVDCGGGCKACLVGQKCNGNGDCAPGHTCNSSKLCQ
jgi:hypothetical protein